MAYKLFTKTDATDRRSSLVLSQTNQAPIAASSLSFVFGEVLSCNIYPVHKKDDGAFNYDETYDEPADGTLLKVGFGIPGATPKSGTFTLTFSGQTTSALAYNCTAAQMQTALQALSSIGTNNVNVKGAFPTYEVQFVGALGLSDQPLITSDSQLLFPDSTVNVATKVAGDATNNEIQVITITADPVTLTTSWTDITTGEDETLTRIGFSGTIDFGTAGIAEMFPLNQKTIVGNLDIVAIDPSGVPKWLGSPQVTILNRVVNPGLSGSAVIRDAASGTKDIPNAVNTVTVSGLNLHNTPRQVQVSVRRPAGGNIIIANVNTDTITSAGFTAELSAITDNANYKLDYTFIF